MKVLLTSATPFEIAPCKRFLEQEYIQYQNQRFQKGANSCDLLLTGVGLPATIFQLSQYLNKHSIDLVINAGIAGAFDPNTAIGSVWQVVEDRFGDLGVQEADGSFSDLFDIELLGKDEFPYAEKRLVNAQGAAFGFLPKAKALTVNKVHGYSPDIEAIRKKYDVQLESMEGAGVFYTCQMLHVPVLQIRSVSNIVESRNRESWNIPLAIEALNKVLIQIISTLL